MNTESTYMTSLAGCTWCDGVGTAPNGEFCGECNLIHNAACQARKSVKVVFLDYDGVVNTAMWDEEGKHCRYNFPEDNKVNNYQAVQWVSEFCEKNGYDIVVSSTWRLYDNYKECLINGGLRQSKNGLSTSIKILGRTEEIKHGYHYGQRGEEIKQYLTDHPEIAEYLIFDDEDDFLEEQKDHILFIDGDIGFTINDYYKACRMAERLENKKLIKEDN